MGATQEWGRPNRGDFSRIIDAGFNGGALCSFNWLVTYRDYLKSIRAETKISQKGEEIEFVAVGPESRDSMQAAAIPIRAQAGFKSD